MEIKINNDGIPILKSVDAESELVRLLGNVETWLEFDTTGMNSKQLNALNSAKRALRQAINMEKRG